MSELSELIEINRNIEKQNEEIIRLLMIIAGEKDSAEKDAGEQIKNEDEFILDDSLDVGEVYFIDEDLFKLSVRDDETIIDNLTAESECRDYDLAKRIAIESLRINKNLKDHTVIVTDSTKGKLPDALKLCIENGAKYVHIPWNQMAELISAPQVLQTLLKLDFYKTEDALLEKLFD